MTTMTKNMQMPQAATFLKLMPLIKTKMRMTTSHFSFPLCRRSMAPGSLLQPAVAACGRGGAGPWSRLDVAAPCVVAVVLALPLPSEFVAVVEADAVCLARSPAAPLPPLVAAADEELMVACSAGGRCSSCFFFLCLWKVCQVSMQGTVPISTVAEFKAFCHL